MKKIDLFVNGKYICSSIRYKTCKAFIQRIKDDNGFLEWQGIKSNRIQITPFDKVKACFSK
jgi:hypothetical protein